MTIVKRALSAAIVLMIAVAFGVFANGSSEQASSSQGTAAGLVKAAFIVSNMANESQAFSSKQFLKYGAQYGFDMYTFDAKGDTQAESQIVTNCIAQKFKVIFLNPNDINAIVPSLIKAKQAGLIVGMFSSDLAPANQKLTESGLLQVCQRAVMLHVKTHTVKLQKVAEQTFGVKPWVFHVL